MLSRYRSSVEIVPGGQYLLPLGVARTVTEGRVLWPVGHHSREGPLGRLASSRPLFLCRTRGGPNLVASKGQHCITLSGRWLVRATAPFCGDFFVGHVRPGFGCHFHPPFLQKKSLTSPAPPRHRRDISRMGPAGSGVGVAVLPRTRLEVDCRQSEAGRAHAQQGPPGCRSARAEGVHGRLLAPFRGGGREPHTLPGQLLLSAQSTQSTCCAQGALYWWLTVPCALRPRPPLRSACSSRLRSLPRTCRASAAMSSTCAPCSPGTSRQWRPP